MPIEADQPSQDLMIETAMLQINGLSPFYFSATPPEETAFLILPGPRDHDYREKEGIRLWQTWKTANFLLVAGTREEPPINKEYILELSQAPLSNLFFQQRARHTPDQTEWAFDILNNSLPFVKHLIISTGTYHVPRGFLTCLQTMRNREKLILLSTAPVYDPKDPSRDFTGLDYTGGDGIKGEIKRIKDYQIAGDVASIDIYLDYLKWRLAQ